MIELFLTQNKLPSFRHKQFCDHFYKEGKTSFQDFSTWSKDLRNKADEEIDILPLIPFKVFPSKNKSTIKVILKRKKDGSMLESVLMRHRDGRNTVCVSCMIGCPVKCSFCATGKMGFIDNLSEHEIVEQMMYFQRILLAEEQKVTNVVFMGMGEPLLNLDNVQKAIEIFMHPDKCGLGARRIVVSTSGYVPQLYTLIESGYRGKLAISLHAPTQELRTKLMPLAAQFPLEELMKCLNYYYRLTHKRISYEYILIDGINDSENDAKLLAKLLKNRLAHVNLIPYNPIPNDKFRRSSKETILTFSSILESYDIVCTTRVTMGDDVDAACGQLITSL